MPVPTPDSSAVRELQQIPFEHLIGAPLKASVEAQALAAQSTIDFIERVGFKAPDSDNPFWPDPLFDDLDQDADAGELRNITFSYEKLDENDTRSTFELTVPLLSIVPIPYIRIDEVTIDFSAKLTDAVSRNTSSSFNLATSASGKYSAFFSPIKLSFRVSSTYNRKTATAATARREYAIDVNVRAVQDELPSGLSKILDILEDAIEDVPANGNGGG